MGRGLGRGVGDNSSGLLEDGDNEHYFACFYWSALILGFWSDGAGLKPLRCWGEGWSELSFRLACWNLGDGRDASTIHHV